MKIQILAAKPRGKEKLTMLAGPESTPQQHIDKFKALRQNLENESFEWVGVFVLEKKFKFADKAAKVAAKATETKE